MRVITVSPSEPREDRLAGAVEALEQGEVVATPTETFYGLAADAFRRDALVRINRLKRKDAASPILLLLGESAQVEQVSAAVPPLFEELAQLFWPGPLTLVIPARPEVPEEVTGGLGTVAVRVPGLDLPRRLAQQLGRPITGPSANRSGQPPCRTAAEVAAIFGDELPIILDGGSTAAGAPSTIVDLSGDRPALLREGRLPRTALQPFLPDLTVR